VESEITTKLTCVILGSLLTATFCHYLFFKCDRYRCI